MSSVLCNQTITGSLSLSGTLTLSAASLPTLQIGSSNTYKIQKDTVSGNTLDIYSGNAMGPTLEMNASKESTFYGKVTVSGLNSDLICTGDVGINTTSPSTKLHVVGTIRGGGSTDYIELDTNGNIKFADTSAGILPAANGTQTLSIGTTMTGNWDTIRHYFDNEVVWNPGSFGLPDDMNLDTSGNLSIGGDFTVSGGDITLGGTGRIQGVDTVSASTDAANKAYVDAHTPTNTQTILFSNFSDDSSSTSAFRIPFNTLSETTSNQYYNHFDCPSSGTIKRIRLNNTSGSPSTGFTVIFDIWRSASGSPTQSSSSITVASGGVVEYDPDLTFSKGDEIQIAYRKSAGGKYLRGVSASIILEFTQI